MGRQERGYRYHQGVPHTVVPSPLSSDGEVRGSLLGPSSAAEEMIPRPVGVGQGHTRASASVRP